MRSIKTRRLLTAVMTAAMLLTLSQPVFAVGEEGVTIHVSTEKDLIKLAEKCSLDTYSEGLTVILDNDIELSAQEFSPVPTFSGTFDGNGHKITGFTLATDGSHQGFFRYIQEGGIVKNLRIEGTVCPDNSRCEVGGIVGVNRGTVDGCTFVGKVEGLNYIGGIAGINYGTLSLCAVRGTVSGKRFTGGIAGYSNGTITGCRNNAAVNTTITEGGLELDNLDLSDTSDALSIVSAEDSDIVSDTGGIVGYSQGTVLNCRNHADIGYPHYGYNIGGVAGRQSGYIYSCLNYGNVYGKKDVAGIVGQMEPYLILKDEHSLKNAINALIASAQKALADAGSQSGEVTDALNAIQSSAESASNRVYLDERTIPVPGGEDVTVSTVQFEESEDGTTISDDISSMTASMAVLNSAMGSLARTLVADLSVVNANASIVLSLFANALAGNLNVVDYEDISSDSSNLAEKDIDGKVALCENHGRVEGDTNIGGIAGAMQVEYEFDMDNTLTEMFQDTVSSVKGITSFVYRAKCVNVYNVNRGGINGRKETVGGVVGYHDIGTVVYDENYGDVSSEGPYVGGIAGESTTLIDRCYAMCTVDGSEYVGGIVGLGKKITNCATIVKMDGVTACFGAIAGYADVTDKANITGNKFATNGLGAIDGISYSGTAEPVEYSMLITDEDLPSEFRNLKLTFMAEGKVVKEVSFTYGGSVPESAVPEVPEKPGYTGQWEKDSFSNLSFSETVEAVYTPRQGAVASETTDDESGLPVIVLDGDFPGACTVEVRECEAVPPDIDGELLECWTVCVNGDEELPGAYGLRYLAPKLELANHSHVVYVLDNNTGSWEKADISEHGSYLGFDVDEDKVTFACYDVRDKGETALFAVIICLAVLVIAVIIIANVRTRKKNGVKEDEADTDTAADS